MDRRPLTLGIALVFVGAYFILRRIFGIEGPGSILVLLGLIFLTISAARGFRGPLLAGGVLLGLGAALVAEDSFEAVIPRWAMILLGLGCGFLLAAGIDRASGRNARRAAWLPGTVLVAIALGATLAARMPFAWFRALHFDELWPWALLLAGMFLIAQSALSRRKQ
jgi:hypothetical protein